MVEVEETLFMGKRIVDVWGRPEKVMKLVDDLLNIEGFYLTQFHPIQALPFYHAMLEYVPKKEKWYRRIFNAKKENRNNPIYEKLREEEEYYNTQQEHIKNSETIGEEVSRMQVLRKKDLFF